MDEVPAPVDVMDVRPFPEENFDHLLLPGYGNASAVRSRFKARLKLRLDDLERVCGLTDVQKAKLGLSAQGDMKRFFDEIDRIKSKFRTVRHDHDAVQQLIVEAQPLQAKLAAGLFDEKSLFQKSVRTILSAEQTAKFLAASEERERDRYTATVSVALIKLENTIQLRHSQRQSLLEWIAQGTPPPASFGDTDYTYVMFQLSRLPEEKVKSVLDARQWVQLEQLVQLLGNMEQELIDRGALVKVKPKPVPGARRAEPNIPDNAPAVASEPAMQIAPQRKSD